MVVLFSFTSSVQFLKCFPIQRTGFPKNRVEFPKNSMYFPIEPRHCIAQYSWDFVETFFLFLFDCLKTRSYSFYSLFSCLALRHLGEIQRVSNLRPATHDPWRRDGETMASQTMATWIIQRLIRVLNAHLCGGRLRTDCYHSNTQIAPILFILSWEISWEMGKLRAAARIKARG